MSLVHQRYDEVCIRWMFHQRILSDDHFFFLNFQGSSFITRISNLCLALPVLSSSWVQSVVFFLQSQHSKSKHYVFPVCSVSVQSLSHVWLFTTPWTAAHQASLSITNSWSLLKLMSSQLVIPSNHLILFCPLLLPSVFPIIRSFPVSQFFTSGGQSIGISASASVLPVNIQDWFPLGLTGLNSLQSKGLSSLLQHHSSKGINSSKIPVHQYFVNFFLFVKLQPIPPIPFSAMLSVQSIQVEVVFLKCWKIHVFMYTFLQWFI